MKKLLAFAGSNSSTSINHQLVEYTISLIQGYEIELLKMNQFSLPLYSIDKEQSEGYPNTLIHLKNGIATSAGLIMSVNEHNSMISAYFKNIMDWLSRLDRSFLNEKKIFLMSTSPGKRGALSALEYTNSVLPRFGATIIETFSLPTFYENFKEGKISDKALSIAHAQKLDVFLDSL